MAEVKFDKDKKTSNKMENTMQASRKRPVGRPKSGRKSYQTMRLLKSTVIKVNALENALSIRTQDETVDRAIDRLIETLSSDEKKAYGLWLEMLKKKEKY